MNNQHAKQIITISTLTVILLMAGLTSGCSAQKKEIKALSATIESALLQANSEYDKKAKISLLRKACDDFDQLKVKWPDCEKKQQFMSRFGSQLGNTPRQVYSLAVEMKDLESFKWAIARSIDLDTSSSSLKKYWDCGPPWREFLLSESPVRSAPVFIKKCAEDNDTEWIDILIKKFPEEAVPAFFTQASKDNNTTFFDEYMGAIRENTDRTTKSFMLYYADAVKKSVKEKDEARVKFLLENGFSYKNIFPHGVSEFSDATTAMGEYVFYELKDEALALKFLELGYLHNTLDLSKTGFSDNFLCIFAKLDEAAYLLKLNEPYSKDEPLGIEYATFLRHLPEGSYIHPSVSYSIIERCIKAGHSSDAIHFIKFRKESIPRDTVGYISVKLNFEEYVSLLNLAIHCGDTAVANHIMEQSNTTDVFDIDLVQLAGNYELFLKYVPESVNVGVLYEILSSPNQETSLYIVKNFELEDRDKTRLMAVCEGGNLDAAKYLIEEKGADVNARTDYRGGNPQLLQSPKEGKYSVLMYAAAGGNCELINYLLDKGCSINDTSYFGTTPLMLAAGAGHEGAVDLLIKCGADVNAKLAPKFGLRDSARSITEYVKVGNAYRRAQKNGHKEVMKILEAAGATP